MKRLLLGLCAVAIVAVATADAQSVVVPNAFWTTAGTGGNNSLTRELPRTFQFGIAASELSGIPTGAFITGVSFRSNNSASNPTTWPAADIAWKNYDIYLAQAAVPIASFSTTFANNMKNPVQVRGGPMTIKKGSYTRQYSSGTTPNPFTTFYYDFKTPYQYQGGDLVLFIDHDGNTASTYYYLNYTASNAAGHGVTLAAFGTYQAKVATSTNYSFVIHRFHYGYGPAGCSGTNGALNLILSHDLAKPTPPPGTINIAVTNGVPRAAGALIVSATGAPAPFPIPGGCNLLILPPFLLFLPIILDANGRYDLNLTFPAVTLGTVAAQAYATDPGAKTGFVVTNGINLTIKQ
jgi:hypothetical protein